MEKENPIECTARETVGWKERIERSNAEKWERQKRLADALMGFVERVTDGNHVATDGELHALPGVADVCSRLL